MTDYDDAASADTNQQQHIAARLFGCAFTVVAFQIVVARWPLKSESKRRCQHAITGHALVQISYLLPYKYCILALSGASFVMYITRRLCPTMFFNAVGPILRDSERGQNVQPGALWFLIGTLLTLLLFPIQTARYSVECLALADPMAAWVGKSIQSRKISASSSVAGTTACFVTAFCVGCVMLLWSVPDLSDDETIAAAAIAASLAGKDGIQNVHHGYWSVVFGAIACAVSEAYPFTGLNDNLTIPIITAAAAHSSRMRW